MLQVLRRGVVSAIACLVFSAVAMAQNNRSAVSITGLDTNTCTVPDPCRTFGVAISKTNAGGELIVLSSGGYGPFTVNKSVSIISPAGIHAAIAPAAGTAITITPSANDIVVLRGLYLNGLGGSTGIDATSTVPLTLHVESCVINGFTGDGIKFSGTGYLLLKDLFVRHNSSNGIRVVGIDASNKAFGTIDRCRIERNGNFSGIGADGGVVVQDYSEVTVRDSVAAGNFRGFQAILTGGTPTARLAIENCVAANNAVGVFAGTDFGSASTVIVRVSNSVLTHNTLFAIESQAGAQILSRLNNTVVDNAGGETFTGSFAAK